MERVCHQGVFVVELREKSCNKTCCCDVLDAFDDFLPDWKILKIWENIHKCKYCQKSEGELKIFSPGCSSYWIRKVYRGQPWQPASFSPDSLFLIKIVLSSYCVTYFIYLLFKRKANVGLPVSSIEVGLRSDSLVKLGAFSFPDSWAQVNSSPLGKRMVSCLGFNKDKITCSNDQINKCYTWFEISPAMTLSLLSSELPVLRSGFFFLLCSGFTGTITLFLWQRNWISFLQRVRLSAFPSYRA